MCLQAGCRLTLCQHVSFVSRLIFDVNRARDWYHSITASSSECPTAFCIIHAKIEYRNNTCILALIILMMKNTFKSFAYTCWLFFSIVVLSVGPINTGNPRRICWNAIAEYRNGTGSPHTCIACSLRSGTGMQWAGNHSLCDLEY